MRLRLIITEDVVKKLSEKHRVTRTEVVQCFGNILGGFLEDNREDHKTDPPTQWFISETDAGRELKVVFVREADAIFLKSAFDPNADEKRIYNKYGF